MEIPTKAHQRPCPINHNTGKKILEGENKIETEVVLSEGTKTVAMERTKEMGHRKSAQGREKGVEKD